MVKGLIDFLICWLVIVLVVTKLGETGDNNDDGEKS